MGVVGGDGELREELKGWGMVVRLLRILTKGLVSFTHP